MASEPLHSSLDSHGLAFRLGLAWLICALPRLVFAQLFDLGTCYRYFLDGDTDAMWYPLYAGMARWFWSLSGERLWLYVGFHLVIHALIGPLVYLLSRSLDLGSRTAWLAVAGVAFMPYYVSVGARQPQVGVTIVMVALLILVFVEWVRNGFGLGYGASFVAVTGVTVMLRPNVMSTVAALYLLALLRARGERAPTSIAAVRRIVASAVLFAGVLLALAGANFAREGRFSPFTGNVGFNLYMGNNPNVTEYALRYDITAIQDSTADGIPPDVSAVPLAERDRVFKRLALEYMREHPGRTLLNAILKTWRYWDIRLEDARLTPLYENLAYTVPYLIYAVLALVGSRELWRDRRRDALILIWTVLLTYWAPHSILFGTVRMRMTTEFLLVMLAAYAVASCTAAGRREAVGQG